MVHEVSSQVKDPSKGSKVIIDQALIVVKPEDLEDKGNQSIKMGSWSNSDDQQEPRVSATSFRARKDYPLVKNLILSCHV